MPYAETLPTDCVCPPVDAEDGGLEEVYRLTSNNPPLGIDFDSKAATGIPCPSDKDPCNWASCSLFKKAKSLRSYNRLRHEKPYLAKLTIPAGSGKFKIGEGKRGHVDFWRYYHVCLSRLVVSVEGPGNDD